MSNRTRRMIGGGIVIVAVAFGIGWGGGGVNDALRVGVGALIGVAAAVSLSGLIDHRTKT